MRDEPYRLHLYVAGNTERSLRAVRNIRRLCDERLHGNYSLEVFDLYQEPQLAADVQVLAAPTLIKLLPLPVRRLVGDLANRDKVVAALGLAARTALS